MDKKKRKLQNIYSRNLLTKKIILPMVVIGKNLDDVIEEYISNNFEGKCIVEGFVKPKSTKIISYSCGVIVKGNNILINVVFECDICFPVEGMLISCVVKNITKAGIRAESSDDVPSPVVIFMSKEHHHNNSYFNDVNIGDIITCRVIAQRFELNDHWISITGEFVKEKEFNEKKNNQKQKKLKLTIEDD